MLTDEHRYFKLESNPCKSVFIREPSTGRFEAKFSQYYVTVAKISASNPSLKDTEELHDSCSYPASLQIIQLGF